MKLTTERVAEIFEDCLFRDNEDTSKAIKVEGIISTFGFHPERLKNYKEEIAKLLNELPDNFHKNKGGGWTFLNACLDKNGRQWGEHQNMEQLFSIAIGVGLAKYCLPREMWKALPGGMPYIQVDIK